MQCSDSAAALILGVLVDRVNAGSRFGSIFTQVVLTRGWGGRYCLSNIDTLLATLANPMAAQSAAGERVFGFGLRRCNPPHLNLQQSPDGGQAHPW
jgi:hypothetical protein